MSIGRGIRTASNRTIYFGVIPIVLLTWGILANAWVHLAASGAGVAQGFNFLSISDLYLIFWAAAPGLWLLAAFKFKAKPISLGFILASGVGLALMFGITAAVGLIETNGFFQVFQAAAVAAGGTPSLIFSTIDLVTSPAFYGSWIFINGAGEDAIFLPIFWLLYKASPTKQGLASANIATGVGFSVLHYVKETLIYGAQLPLPAYLFLVAAFFVRIGLNMLMFYTGYLAPSMLAHGTFDFLVSFVFGVGA